MDGTTPLQGSRFTEGESLDGKGNYSLFKNKPMGEEPKLAPGPASAYGQKEEQKLGVLGAVKEAIVGH